jgi:cell division protein FtsW
MRRRPDSFGMNDWKRTILPAIGPVLVLVGLVVLEPDLGTAVEIFIIAVAMLYVAGLNGRYIIGAGLAAIPIIYLLIVRVSYRYERVVAFLNPTADPQGRGFQLLQSLIAVGSGGFTGVGLMESKQKLFYLPEAHTDFIFAVVGEEMGMIGT